MDRGAALRRAARAASGSGRARSTTSCRPTCTSTTRAPWGTFLTRRSSCTRASSRPPGPQSHPRATGYVRDDYDRPELQWQLFDGDLDLFGDGAIRLLETPGHSAGHVSLLLIWTTPARCFSPPTPRTTAPSGMAARILAPCFLETRGALAGAPARCRRADERGDRVWARCRELGRARARAGSLRVAERMSALGVLDFVRPAPRAPRRAPPAHAMPAFALDRGRVGLRGPAIAGDLLGVGRYGRENKFITS